MGREHTGFIDAHGQKEEQKLGGPQKLQVLLVNDTLGMEIDELIHVLLYEQI